MKTYILELSTVRNAQMVKMLPKVRAPLSMINVEERSVFIRKAVEKQLVRMPYNIYQGRLCGFFFYSDQDEIFSCLARHFDEEEKDLIQKFYASLRKICSEGHRIITWNGCMFHFPFIAGRGRLLGVPHETMLPHLSVLTDKKSSLPHYDLRNAYFTRDKYEGIADVMRKIKNLKRHFNRRDDFSSICKRKYHEITDRLRENAMDFHSLFQFVDKVLREEEVLQEVS